MEIYEIVHIGKDDMKGYVRNLFRDNAHLKDQRVIDMLVEKGYMDLEDTLLQHKQKTHLMTLLQGKDETNSNRKVLNEKSTSEEFDARWLA
jgi:NADH dehydrogenase (ubiquinone) 1 alpha subcomplex subunit 6